MKLGLMLLSEYAHMLTVSFLLAILFLGGWSFFGLENLAGDGVAGVILKFAIMGTKMFGFVMMFLLVRWTIPRFRFDQLMDLAWKVLIPLALLHLVAAMLIQELRWPPYVLTVISVSLFIAAGLLAARKSGPNNAPRRRAVPLPVGVPAGVTYISR
jgi:NADH-quinone oxidoreductase subunit H